MTDTFARLLAAAAALVVAWKLLRLLAVYVFHAFLGAGDWPRAERWLRRFGGLIRPWYRETMALAVAEFSGRTEAAVTGAERLIAETPLLHPLAVNQCVNILINAGRYTRALEIAALCPEASSSYERDLTALLEVNVAEAEYNLGRWSHALARLDRVREDEKRRRVSTAGVRGQKAWILAHLGQATEARAALEQLILCHLPALYHAEYHFTRACVARAEGDLEEALAAVDEGLALSRRAASRRNGRFLRARMREARGETAAALADFEEAARLPYRGQGGDGLLAWGDLLQRLGRGADARGAWALALERDPESESAREAERRLRS